MPEDDLNIREVFNRAGPALDRLSAVYGRLPSMRCRMRGLCCQLLPEMSFLEFLGVVRAVNGLDLPVATEATRRLVRYFFVNPVRLTSCPFLENNRCLVYEGRPFGCRAYGLWSPEYYRNRRRETLKGKAVVREAWRRLGIELPTEVADFSISYCRNVRPDPHAAIDDDTLNDFYDEVLDMSAELGDHDESFYRLFLNDASFLAAASVVTHDIALNDKVTVVRETIEAGESRTLSIILSRITQQAVGRLFPAHTPSSQ